MLIFLPSLSFPFLASNAYKGINITQIGTDQHYYLTRGKEILEGHGLGNIVLREGKDGQEPHFSYIEYIVLAPVRLLGFSNINVVTLYNAYNFVGMFLLIVLIYIFVLQLSADKLLSVTAALFAVGGYTMVYYKTIGYPEVNAYTRAVFPYLSSIAFFIFLNLLYKSLKSDKLKYIIFAGIAFGSLFYVYLYAWSFALALSAGLFAIYLLRSDFVRLKKISAVLGIGLAVGAYNLSKLISFYYNSDMGRQTAYFLYFVHARTPIFSKIGFAALILFLIFALKRRDNPNLSFILATILGGWISLNQQILTSKIVYPAHYYWYFIVPLSIIIGLYMFWFLVPPWKYKNALLYACMGLVFINTGLGQYGAAQIEFKSKLNEQNYKPILDYLKNNPYGVVLAPDDDVGYLVTIYTSGDLFWHTTALSFNMPAERLTEAALVYFYLNKKARYDFVEYTNELAQNKNDESYYKSLHRYLEGYLSGFEYTDYRLRLAADDAELGQKRIKITNELYQEYKKMTGSGVINILNQRGVNYIIWDKNKNPEWDLSFIKNLKEIVSYNGIFLYQI